MSVMDDAPRSRTMGPQPRLAENKRRSMYVAIEGKMAMLIRGELSVEDMDVQELARLQFRDKRGGFTGRPPAHLPRNIVLACRDELMRRANEMFASSLTDAIAVFVDIATNPGNLPKDRLHAAEFIVNRVMGKTPDRVEVSGGEKPWQIVLGKIEADIAAQAAKDEITDGVAADGFVHYEAQEEQTIADV